VAPWSERLHRKELFDRCHVTRAEIERSGGSSDAESDRRKERVGGFTELFQGYGEERLEDSLATLNGLVGGLQGLLLALAR
jgi:hypothetical protein